MIGLLVYHFAPRPPDRLWTRSSSETSKFLFSCSFFFLSLTLASSSWSAPRKKNKFMEDSAVESDGEGGDILSVASSPPNSPLPSPLRSSSSVNVALARPITKTAVAKVFYADCNNWLSGPKQFDRHLKGKKHLKNIRNKTTSCNFCNHHFQSKHNFRFHSCQNRLENEKFYKLYKK